MRSIQKLGLVLLLPVPLTGCETIPWRVVTANEMCRDWQHQTISKKDVLTEQTASQIEANNKSRPAWGCAYGKNESKS